MTPSFLTAPTLADHDPALLAFFGGIGAPEMLVVGVVAVLLFGNRLPSVARSFGRSLTEFKRGMRDIQDDFHRAIDAEEDDSRTVEDEARAIKPAPAPASVARGETTTSASHDEPATAVGDKHP